MQAAQTRKRAALSGPLTPTQVRFVQRWLLGESWLRSDPILLGLDGNCSTSTASGLPSSQLSERTTDRVFIQSPRC